MKDHDYPGNQNLISNVQIPIRNKIFILLIGVGIFGDGGDVDEFANYIFEGNAYEFGLQLNESMITRRVIKTVVVV